MHTHIRRRRFVRLAYNQTTPKPFRPNVNLCVANAKRLHWNETWVCSGMASTTCRCVSPASPCQPCRPCQHTATASINNNRLRVEKRKSVAHHRRQNLYSTNEKKKEEKRKRERMPHEHATPLNLRRSHRTSIGFGPNIPTQRRHTHTHARTPAANVHRWG